MRLKPSEMSHKMKTAYANHYELLPDDVKKYVNDLRMITGEFFATDNLAVQNKYLFFYGLKRLRLPNYRIGKFFGMDHTTVNTALQKIEYERKQYPDIREKTDKIEGMNPINYIYDNQQWRKNV